MIATSTASHFRRSRAIPVSPLTPASEKKSVISSPPRARTGLCQVGAE